MILPDKFLITNPMEQQLSNYFLGADVSKGYADFTMVDHNKNIVEQNFQLDDTFSGHQKLYQFLLNFFSTHNDATVYAAVESTGGYENNWFHTLSKYQKQHNFYVARINPKGVNHNSKAGLNRITTDPISARNIAEYLIAHPEKVTYQSRDPYYTFRRKWKLVRSLSNEKVKYLNQLETMLYEANPELLVYCKYGVGKWLLKLLQLFPTASDLSTASIEKIALIPYISKARARELVKNAKQSVASVSDELTADSICILATKILDQELLIKQQVKVLAAHCPFKELELLKSFNSIGDYSAIGLLIEIGPIERFKTVKQLASFFGLHPAFKNSGDGAGNVRMSKQGRKEPRRILFMVALSAISQNQLIKEIYQHNLQKGKCKMDAIGVCMHKILRIIFGMLKNNTKFDPMIDQNYRNRSMEKKKKDSKNQNRRFQIPDSNAPISRRQDIKRKEQEQSQNDRIAVDEIKFPPLSLN